MLQQIHESLINKVLGNEQTQGITSIISLVRPDLSKYYSNEPLILDEAISKLDSFIRDSRVQHSVKSDFEAGNYEQFDPNTGDNGCESRIFLYKILLKKAHDIDYEKLTPNEKLILSICHIASRCMVDSKDNFGVLSGTKTTEVVYSDPLKNNNNTNIKKHNKNRSPYSARELLEYAVSYFSVQFMSEAAKRLGDELSDDIKSYNRFKKQSGKDYILPPQMKNGPASALYFEYTAVCKVTLLLKIINLKIDGQKLKYSSTSFYTYDYDSNSTPRIVELSDELKSRLIDSNEPVAIYEGVSVLQSNQTDESLCLQKRLLSYLREYIICQSIEYDSTHDHKISDLKSEKLLSAYDAFKDVSYNPRAYSELSKAVADGKDISRIEIPLNMIHAYLGCMKKEIAIADSLSR